MDRKLSQFQIVRELAETVANRITRNVIKDLQGMDYKLSGEDSGLVNVWDEICLQMQFEESIYWNRYDQTVRALVDARVE